MDDDTGKLLDELKRLVEKSKDQGMIIKQELDTLIPNEEFEIESVHEEESSEDVKYISEALSNIKLSQISKLRKYTKGENFSTFCERFKEYSRI